MNMSLTDKVLVRTNGVKDKETHLPPAGKSQGDIERTNQQYQHKTHLYVRI